MTPELEEKIDGVRRTLAAFAFEKDAKEMLLDIDVLQAILAFVPEKVDPSLRAVLKGEDGTCYLCKEIPTEFLSFASKVRTTRMELCLTHFDGMRTVFQEYIRAQRIRRS